MHSLSFLVLALALSQTPQIQSAVINAAKNFIVRDMDKTLPPVTFEAGQIHGKGIDGRPLGVALRRHH